MGLETNKEFIRDVELTIKKQKRDNKKYDMPYVLKENNNTYMYTVKRNCQNVECGCGLAIDVSNDYVGQITLVCPECGDETPISTVYFYEN